MPSKGIRSRLVRASLWPLSRLLKTGDRHTTIDRLFDSKHVRDLQLIIALSCVAFFLTGCVGAAIVVLKMLHGVWHWDDATVKCVTYGAPALVALGGLVGWAYKTGSSRLGVVDLFACEISTLCRVTTVIETVRLAINRVDHPPAEHADRGKTHLHGISQFTSVEEYFPIFVSNNSTLQSLEANVVINITAFYTYMKTFRDSLRALAQIGPGVAEAHDRAAHGAWRTAAINSIYVLYLGLESARHALMDLVEFEPEQAERIIVVLLSELEAFHFLRGVYFEKDDIYNRRIELRVPEYREAVGKLIALAIRHEKARVWAPAYLLLDELQRRYVDAISDFHKGGPPEHSLEARA